MAIWRDVVVEALRSIGGQGALEQIYRAAQAVSTRPLPRTWRDIIRRELEYNSSDSASFKHRHDLFYSVNGLGGGVWGLREYDKKTPTAPDIVTPPERILSTVYRILRDTALARRLKRLYADRCQICGETLLLSEGVTYSEAHHIRPLGSPHNGPDEADNILILCPNHHVLCDYGAITLKQDALKFEKGHEVSDRHLAYHNDYIVPSNDE